MRVQPCDQPNGTKQISSKFKGSIPLVPLYAREGDYLMKLDLNDACYAVPMHPESRKYLRFQFKLTTF